MIAAGALDRRIRIETADLVDDGHQKRAGAWAEVASVAAQFIPARGREARGAAGREELRSASFRVRWSPTIAALGTDCRVIFPAQPGGAAWDVQSIIEIGRREGLEIVCTAAGNG